MEISAAARVPAPARNRNRPERERVVTATVEGIMLSWPATLMEFWSWHVEAACRAVDMSLFYSPEGERGPRKRRRERAAKEICAGCKVAEVCAAFAVATQEPYGTWGGLSEGDRRKLWRRTDQAAAQLGYRRALADWERRQAG
jgi:WhiB family transcriptional regulator, redox-sensing transcriptional regulator